MASSSPLEAILSSFSWSENRRAGHFDLLSAQLRARKYDLARDRLFSVGDLIDRGDKSKSVLDMVRRYRIRAVRGNHEQAILDWLASQEASQDNRRRVHQHLRAFDERRRRALEIDFGTSHMLDQGAAWFVRLYCDSSSAQLVEEISSYFASLPHVIEVETDFGLVGIVHADPLLTRWERLTSDLKAGFSDEVELSLMLHSRIRWLPNAWVDPMEGVAAVLVGHTPTRDVAQRGRVINIDTGAAYGNKLTVFDIADVPACLDAGERGIS